MHRVPLFPLPVVVFPGEELPLHIYEERYRDLLRGVESKKEPNEIAIPPVIEQKLASIGTTVMVEDTIEQYEDGRFDISTRGLRRFRLIRVEKNLSYSEGYVEFFDDLETLEPLNELREKAITLHHKLNEIVTLNNKIPSYEGVEKLSFTLAHNAGLTIREKLDLLVMVTEGERLRYLVQYYKKTIPNALEQQELMDQIRQNGFVRKFDPVDF
jgi:Lon protease-like protein